MNSQASGEFDTIAGNLGVSIADGGKVNTQSFAAFFDFSANLTDRLKVSLGARATRDAKRANVFRYFYLGATPSPYQGGAPRPILQVRTHYDAEKTFEQFTPRVSVSYELSDDLTTYASFSKGYKSGGWDMRGDAFITPQTTSGLQAGSREDLRSRPEGLRPGAPRLVLVGPSCRNTRTSRSRPRSWCPRASPARSTTPAPRPCTAPSSKPTTKFSQQPLGQCRAGLHPRQVRHASAASCRPARPTR
jgi:hypothetical protein